MKPCAVFAVAFGLVLMSLTGLASAQNWEYPVIKGYGKVVSLPGAAVQPEKGLKYKVIWNLGRYEEKEAEGGQKVNAGLWHFARLINVYGSAGVRPEEMDLVGVIHGGATKVALNNDEYRKKFGTDNPNLQLIEELRKAGVKLYVCGQALADNGFRHEWVNPDITIALSTLTVLPTYQLKGYALIP